MLYDRKIKYLDYYEGGVKVNGGGFAKLEVRGNTLRLELTIRGLRPTDSFERDIVLLGAEKEETLGQIRIQNGYGQFRYSCDVDQGIGATGISYNDLRGIRISIGGTREMLCQWDNISDKRRITPLKENAQRSKSGLQESGGEPIAETYTENKAYPEASVYTENEQAKEPKSGKTAERRKESKKEGYESIEDKDKNEENRAATNGERLEVIIREDKDREGQEGKTRDSKGGGRQEEKNREDEDREGQEVKNREDKDREMQEGKNGEDKDWEGQEDKENEEAKENTKKDIGKKESIEKRDNKGLEIRGEDMKNGVRQESPEMQAQGAAMFSDVMSPQVPKETIQTVLQSEEKSGDLGKDKPEMIENDRAEQPDVRKAPVKLMEDKWQQLSAIYPHIQPFRDERDYLSLTPSDFVLFPDRFYRAVNNSFLLHGYYNYHHLILARIERRGEILYYIGVPGNYFEREKQVAIMFGFESFECETEPAKTGDFGYYMMRTEL